MIWTRSPQFQTQTLCYCDYLVILIFEVIFEKLNEFEVKEYFTVTTGVSMQTCVNMQNAALQIYIFGVLKM